MTPFQAYVLYNALHAHFTSKNYDYFKYNGKIRRNYDAFERRNDKFIYSKLSKHPDPKGLIISHFVYGNLRWVGNLFDENSEDKYNLWKKNIGSLTYNLKQDIRKALTKVDHFNELFTVENGQYPILLSLVLKKNISLESAIIIDRVIKYTPHWNKNITDPVAWPTLYTKMVKYSPFIDFDDKISKSILKEECINTLQV